jgi:hypothetical protein
MLLLPVIVWGAKGEVFLYYDESYGYNPDGWGDWKSTKAIEDKIAEELTKARVNFKIGTADEFLAYIEKNPTGIVVSPIVVPENVYSIGMIDKSPRKMAEWWWNAHIFRGYTFLRRWQKGSARSENSAGGCRGK